jgi:hypothetical protein
MGILHDVDGSVFIFLAAAYALRPLRELVRVTRGQTRFCAIPGRAWGDLCLSLGVLLGGITMLRSAGPPWLDWLLLALGITSLAAWAFDVILSRRRAGVSWWRFGVRVIPPPPAAEVTIGDPAPDSGQTLDPGPVTALDARTLSLVEQINNAKFITT